MATKKSSSAAKKKAAKKAAKKATKVKRTSPKQESSSLFTQDVTEQVSLQSPVSSSEERSNQEKEAGKGVYLFLVIAGVLAIAYLGYVKYSKSKTADATAAAAVDSKATATKAPVVEEKPAEPVSSATPGEYLVDKIASKKWTEAATYCQSEGGSLPLQTELASYKESAPDSIKTNAERFWTKGEFDKKLAVAYRFSDGKVSRIDKTKSLQVLCKK